VQASLIVFRSNVPASTSSVAQILWSERITLDSIVYLHDSFVSSKHYKQTQTQLIDDLVYGKLNSTTEFLCALLVHHKDYYHLLKKCTLMFKSLSLWIPEKTVRNDRFSGDENKLGRWGSGVSSCCCFWRLLRLHPPLLLDHLTQSIIHDWCNVQKNN
jgi:hypothetical protein